jgi:hypothetical protein
MKNCIWAYIWTGTIPLHWTKACEQKWNIRHVHHPFTGPIIGPFYRALSVPFYKALSLPFYVAFHIMALIQGISYHGPSKKDLDLCPTVLLIMCVCPVNKKVCNFVNAHGPNLKVALCVTLCLRLFTIETIVTFHMAWTPLTHRIFQCVEYIYIYIYTYIYIYICHNSKLAMVYSRVKHQLWRSQRN